MSFKVRNKYKQKSLKSSFKSSFLRCNAQAHKFHNYNQTIMNADIIAS